MTNDKTESGVRRVHVDQLVADPANARTHPQRNIDAVKRSLRRFGQQKPLVVTPTMLVVAGNCTLLAARQLAAEGHEGFSELEVKVTTLAPTEASAYAIADNRTAELAEWDYQVLAGALQGFDEETRLDAGWLEQEVEALTSVSFDEVVDNPREDVKTFHPTATVFKVVIEVKDEQEQRDLIERMEKEGYTCLPLMS